MYVCEDQIQYVGILLGYIEITTVSGYIKEVENKEKLTFIILGMVTFQHQIDRR